MASSCAAFWVVTSVYGIIAVRAGLVGTNSAVVDVDLVALLVVRLGGPGGVCSTVKLDDAKGTCRLNFPGPVG